MKIVRNMAAWVPNTRSALDGIAFSALCPDAVTLSTASIVTPTAIMKLDATIYHGALEDTSCIPDAFYWTFVMIFCETRGSIGEL
ncbi:hypothetical protein FSST1_000326 [Fusarium sambucinum]